jgi:N-acetylglucosaminyl-diphospho-decaprenol L-rhamnosyltransferase
MKLLIAITSYRVTDLTIDCLRSLSEQISRVPSTKVAVCENGSGGDAAEKLRRAIEQNGWESWVDLIMVYPNRGFAGGTNAAMQPAMDSANPPEYVFLLNSDTVVMDHALDTLVEFMDSHPAAGIAASTLLTPDGKMETSPFRFPGIATELDRGLRLGIVSKLLSPWSLALPKPKEASPVDWASGASLILRRTMLEQIGLLDEGLYTYFDDIDICLRAARTGWQTWYVPESKVIHLGGATTGIASHLVKPRRYPSYWYQARQRFFTKNYGALYTALADAAFITGYAIWRLRRRLQHKPDTDPPYMLIDSIRHSVFCTGPKLKVVENPAMRQAVPQP